MSLRDIHDFELSLVDPLISMTLTGVKVDEPKRLLLIKDLENQREPLADKVRGIILPLIENSNSFPDKHLFYKKWTCKCCRNGKAKKTACWACARFKKQPGKRVLAKYLEKKSLVALPACLVCAGVGGGSAWVFNPSSPAQVKIALFKLLRLPKRMKQKKLSSDEEALKSLVSKDQSGFVKALLEVIKTTTMIRHLGRMQGGEDGRLRTSYNPAGTESGRLSSSETFLFPSTNMQNIPNKKVTALSPLYNVRKCIVPDEGMVWLQADLSQAEARVVAALCEDKELLEQWKDPDFDVHKWTASDIFKKPAAEIVSKERGMGKTARHALNYGMGVNLFMSRVNMDTDLTGISLTKAEATRIHEGYHALHPGLARWYANVDTTLRTSANLTTCFGRKRTFFARRRGDGWLDEAHKEAIAFEPQSTVADLLNTGLLNWWRRGEGTLGTLLLQIHDAIIVQTQPSYVPRVAHLLRECLEIPIKVNSVDLTIPADIEVMHKSWGETVEYVA